MLYKHRMPAIGRFQLAAHPTLSRKGAKVELDYVEFIAVREGEEARTWVIQGRELDALFDILTSPELIADLIGDLRDGRSVTFPDDYSAVHLVLLGYRVVHGKSPQRVSIPSTYPMFARR